MCWPITVKPDGVIIMSVMFGGIFWEIFGCIGCSMILHNISCISKATSFWSFVPEIVDVIAFVPMLKYM